MNKLILKSITLFVVLSLCVVGATHAKEWKTLRVATEGAYPPWNSTEPSGKLIGFDMDVIDEVCKRVGLKYELSAQAWKGIIPGLTAGSTTPSSRGCRSRRNGWK